MTKLSYKNDITVKFENMPSSILGFYVEINNKPYIVLNDILHADMHDFIYHACYYFKDKSYVGKITIADMEKDNFEPFIYARKMVGHNGNRIVC